MTKYKYCDSEVYKQYAFRALSSQFNDVQSFESFYSSLLNDRTKDEFLRVASSYLFFVKNGDWHVNDPQSNPVIEYFTNSFKLLALLAIIESLSDKKHVDFFHWLLETTDPNPFPLHQSQLRSLHDSYKSEYGSIRRCKSFFKGLPMPTQSKLRKSITVDGKEINSIEKFVDMIYKMRSGFAHECIPSFEVSNSWCFSREKGKRIAWSLPMQLLQTAFEEGVIAYFEDNPFGEVT